MQRRVAFARVQWSNAAATILADRGPGRAMAVVPVPTTSAFEQLERAGARGEMSPASACTSPPCSTATTAALRAAGAASPTRCSTTPSRSCARSAQCRRPDRDYQARPAWPVPSSTSSDCPTSCRGARSTLSALTRASTRRRPSAGCFQILGAIAEHALMSERTRDGLAAARARGRVGGPKHKLRPRQAQCARQMYDQVDEQGRNRYTVAEIAAEFGVSRPTIYRCLEDVNVRGRVI